jgi:hypothetical protein
MSHRRRTNRSKAQPLTGHIPVPGEQAGEKWAEPSHYTYSGTGQSWGVCSEPDHTSDLHPRSDSCLDWVAR